MDVFPNSSQIVDMSHSVGSCRGSYRSVGAGVVVDGATMARRLALWEVVYLKGGPGMTVGVGIWKSSVGGLIHYRTLLLLQPISLNYHCGPILPGRTLERSP